MARDLISRTSIAEQGMNVPDRWRRDAPQADSVARIESAWVFVGLVVLVVVIGCLLWWRIVVAYPSLPDRADFGNLFGGINTLFAALAFAALTYTLILQQRALALQRGQLSEQQRDLDAQSARLDRQSFESMLVQLLGFHHAITRDVEVRIGAANFHGRTALRALADELNGHVAAESEIEHRPAIDVVQKAYSDFHRRYRGVLDHYFRNLYHTVKFVDASGMGDARRYTSLIRAQLSPPELLLLFYNCLTPFGEKFRPLVQKYALLEQLTNDELRISSHRSLYEPGAYA